MRQRNALVTAPWGPLLSRILRVVDAIELWDNLIIEKLYIEANGQVDKPFPDIGDLLAVYLVAGRIYKNSPQGWYIATASQFKRTEGPFFWARCCLHPDIPPIPDSAVPWQGPCDPWMMRQKLTNRPMWLRLCETEDFGCSYYNLSDWIKAKRNRTFKKRNSLNINAAKSPRGTLKGSVSRMSPIRTRSVASKFRRSQLDNSSRKRHGRSRFSEYIIADINSESDSGEEVTKSPTLRRTVSSTNSMSGTSVFGITTGKMSNCAFSCTSNSTVDSTKTTPRNMSDGVSRRHSSRLQPDPVWLDLRDETCNVFYNLMAARVSKLSGMDWVTDISQRLETEAVFSKCLNNEDRYIGLRRAVAGILTQFDGLIDSLEMLIPVDDELRTKICGVDHGFHNEPNSKVYIDPFYSDDP